LLQYIKVTDVQFVISSRDDDQAGHDWAAWEALRSAEVVLVPAGHPQRVALGEAGISCQDAETVTEAVAAAVAESGGTVVWLPAPGEDAELPAGATVLRGSADLPGAHLIDLVATMDRLRAGCPWDARQTHASLAPHLLEEPYEALEALESGDERAFCEELGDVLLQVVFHARIAAEREDGTSFTVDDVADGIVAKLVRRHPHVFADVPVSGADEVTRNWDDIKREEKRIAAPAGVPEELTQLDADAGLADPATSGQDIGRELFRLVARARAAGSDPEMELRAVIWTWCTAGSAAP